MPTICTSILLLALIITIARRWGIEKVIKRADNTLSEMQLSEARRNRVSDNPFFADITTGDKKKAFLDRLTNARETRIGADSVYTHVSIAGGQPGTYMIHYFKMDLALLQRFQSCGDSLEKEQLRHRVLSELFLSSSDAYSVIEELGTAFIDSFLDHMKGFSCDPLGDGPSYVYEMPVDLLDQNIPIPKIEEKKAKSISSFIAKHRQISFVCALMCLALALAGLCINFSDSFFYPGIAHCRKYIELFGAISTLPTKTWPIVFSALALPLSVIGIFLFLVIIYQGLFPGRRLNQIVVMVFRRCSFFVTTVGVLMLHYLACDFTGNRWYLLSYMYDNDIFYSFQKVYFYLHEIVPYFVCFSVLWSVIAWSCISQKTRLLCLSTITVLLLLIGLFFLIFDLWLQPWAVLPITLSITLTAGCLIVASRHLNKKRRKRREVYERNTTRD